MSDTGNRPGRIAAVFDIDGTLLPAPSLELRLLAHLALTREMRLGAIGKWLQTLLPQLLGISRGDAEITLRSPVMDRNKSYLSGVRIEAAEKWIAREFMELEFFPDAVAMVDWHRRRGHAIVLISGTLAPLARATGTLLADSQEIYVCATELECDAGWWTGRVAGEAICGPAKARSLVRLAAENQFDLSRSYAYADSMKDRWLLDAVGHPIVVNSRPRLAQHARKHGWRLVNWNDRVRVPAVRKSDQLPGTENSGQIFAEKVLWK